MADIDVNQKALLCLLSNSLTNTITPLPDGASIEKVWVEAHYQAVKPLAFTDFDLSSLDADLQTEVHALLRSRIIANLEISGAHHKLHTILSAAGVEYTIIKGCASAYYYPDPILRASGDVDFLVYENSVSDAEKALLSAGFTRDKENHDHHIVLFDGKTRYEMHTEPAGVPEGKAGDTVRKYLSDTIDSASVREAYAGEMVLPDPFHHGLIILLHAAHHIIGEGIGLRHLCDWAVFINAFDSDEFDSLFYDALKACGLWNFCKILTAACVRFLNARDKKFADDVPPELTDGLISDIFRGGNFGQKDTDRAHESMLISDYGNTGVGKRSKLAQLFSSANHIVYTKWPVAVKVKILLPVGYMFFGVRYIFRSIIGKRPKINVRATISNADKRIDLYKQFRLFENDGDS